MSCECPDPELCRRLKRHIAGRDWEMWTGQCPPERPCDPQKRARLIAAWEANALTLPSLEEQQEHARNFPNKPLLAALDRDVLYCTVLVLTGNCPHLHGAMIRLAFHQRVRLADYGLESFADGETAPVWIGAMDCPGRGPVPFGLIRGGDSPADWNCAFDRRPQIGPTEGARVPLLMNMKSPVFLAGTLGCADDVQLRFVVTP